MSHAEPLSNAVHPAALYVAYHKPSPLIRSTALRPIHVGAALAKTRIDGTVSDARGMTISDLNPSYCELTAHYWAWKNDTDARVLGLMHYRRVLDLDGRPRPIRRPWQPSERYVLRFDPERYAGHVDDFLDYMESAGIDLVLPVPTLLRRSVRDQFAALHDVRDLDVLRETVAELHPSFLPDLDMVLRGRKVVMGNIFIMRRPVFERYSALLFPILDSVYRKLAPTFGQRDAYQARVVGFLAERVMTAFVDGAYLRDAFPGHRIERRPILNTDWPAVRDMRLRRRLLSRWNARATLRPRSV